MTDTDERQWLPLSEAARRLGKSSDAVRAMIRRGRLSTRKGNDGRLLVGVPPDADEPASDSDRPRGEHATDELVQEVMDLRVALARAEAERDAARRIADADVATARAEVAAKDDLIVELKALLAEAWRPWWRRLIR
jgi:hypothetical protein